MKTIVALVDFSDVTQRVIDHTVEVATAMRADVILVHVVVPVSVVADYLPDSDPADETWTDSQAKLQVLRDAANAGTDIQITMRQFKGSVVETLTAQLPLLHPDLVVVGSHGHGTLYNMLVGTVTSEFLKHSAWPVTIIPPERAVEEQPVVAEESIRIDELRPPLVAPLGGPAAPVFS